MTWKPSNEPIRYDRARVERTEPISMELKQLGLPPLRQRKLHGILNALIMQIEDGGDSPEVNRLLVETLRAAVLHQVGEKRARAVLQAIDVFARAEAKRWQMVKAGILPPIELKPEEQLDELMQEGYSLLDLNDQKAACDKWLETWDMVKGMATPGLRTAAAFDNAFPGMMQSVFNWSGDLEMELHNTGLGDPVYHEHRVRYVREFLARFPDEGEDRYLMFRSAEGEALWFLGRQAEAEAVYHALVRKLPDQGWAYIGWSDQYYWGRGRPVDYGRAESLLLQALDRPSLEDRADVLERLVRLYGKWGQPEKKIPFLAELDEIHTHGETQHPSLATGLDQVLEDLAVPPPQQEPLSRNAPCWCGSSKKYKFCHMRSDRERETPTS